MLQRHSPVITYPLQQTSRGSLAWWGLMILSAVVLMLWWWQGAGIGFAWWLRVVASVSVWGLCGALSWQALQRLPQGALRWDGRRWAWLEQGHAWAMQGSPTVVLDMQSLLLLVWVGRQGSGQYFVLEKGWAPDAWSDLRRAVYSSVHPTQDDMMDKGA